MTSQFPRIDSEPVTAYLDLDQGVAYVIYRGELRAESTIAVYKWINSLVGLVEPEQVRGSIYDFRAVTHFHRSNVHAIQKESHRVNIRFDTSRMPVALIVAQPFQEYAVRVAMRITPDEHRKRIVRSEAEALAFFGGWHAKYNSAETTG